MEKFYRARKKQHASARVFAISDQGVGFFPDRIEQADGNLTDHKRGVVLNPKSNVFRINNCIRWIKSEKISIVAAQDEQSVLVLYALRMELEENNQESD